MSGPSRASGSLWLASNAGTHRPRALRGRHGDLEGGGREHRLRRDGEPYLVAANISTLLRGMLPFPQTSSKRNRAHRLVSYLVMTTPPGNVRVSTRFRFTQLSS